MGNKEEFKKVLDDLISSKNDLLDGIYELNCSLSFIAEATNNMMDKENSNIMEDVSYGFYKQLMGLKENLNNIMNKFESNIETSTDNLYFFLEKIK
ncbi:hypothetical protein L5F46_05775 [Aliarcobacter butzleri]|uniref:hypothetical protein n=1 Tax=Aliarcobacter butzleri TaxID=28197 RepID=UPI001EDE51CA|nr:hypothetical protein [Aliarcobacter butzleri]MCG3674283.1 hypothetical protein [Aliarcobacter butzleri]